MKLEKVRVDRMMLEYKVNEMERIARQQEWITWLRMRGKIVQLAREISNYMKQEEKLKGLNRTITDRKGELDVVETEVFSRRFFTSFCRVQFSMACAAFTACYFRFLLS